MKIRLLVLNFLICGTVLATDNYNYQGLKYTGSKQKILIWGGETGWFGQEMVKILTKLGHTAISAKSRLENRQDIIAEIEAIKPDRIVNAAGVTGRPHIDWCEDHRPETIRANIIGALNLVDIAYTYKLHMTNMGTGCLYDFDEKHPKGSGIGFKETDDANHYTSFYCASKVYLEKLLLEYPNVLNLRVRMPLSYDFHFRNFIIKITSYAKVINEPNSLSVLEDLLPVAVDMTLRNLKGSYNFVNPGVMTHNEILDLYQKYVDSSFKYVNFTIAEQDRILKAARSNCELDTTKLLQEYPHIPHIKASVEKALLAMRKIKSQQIK